MKRLEERRLDAAELKDLVLVAVEDRKGIDTTVLDVSTLTDVTDYMIVVGGTSNRHVKAIVDHVLQTAKSHAVQVLGTEGRDRSDWVLLDLADVVVHVMRAETRAFYELERLWEAPALEQPSTGPAGTNERGRSAVAPAGAPRTSRA